MDGSLPEKPRDFFPKVIKRTSTRPTDRYQSEVLVLFCVGVWGRQSNTGVVCVVYRFVVTGILYVDDVTVAHSSTRGSSSPPTSWCPSESSQGPSSPMVSFSGGVGGQRDPRTTSRSSTRNRCRSLFEVHQSLGLLTRCIKKTTPSQVSGVGLSHSLCSSVRRGSPGSRSGTTHVGS